MISTFTHKIPKEKELLLTYANPTKSGTPMYHLAIDWAKPNLYFIQSPPCHMKSMNAGSHGINQSKPNQGFQRSNNLNPQLVIPPHSQTSLTIRISVSTQSIQDSRVFVPTKAPRTSNSTHSCC